MNKNVKQLSEGATTVVSQILSSHLTPPGPNETYPGNPLYRTLDPSSPH
jgi:hypothetical protein